MTQLSTKVKEYRVHVNIDGEKFSVEMTKDEFQRINMENFSQMLDFTASGHKAFRVKNITAYEPIDVKKIAEDQMMDIKSERVVDKETWGMDVERIKAMHVVELHAGIKVKIDCSCGYCTSKLIATDLTASKDGKVMWCNCGYRFPMVFKKVDNERKLESSCPFCN